MTTHHVSLYHPKTNQPESTVLKQELITYQQTSSLTITKLERSFSNGDHLDSYTSEPLLFGYSQHMRDFYGDHYQKRRFK